MNFSKKTFVSAVANGLECKLLECPYNKYHQILPDRMQVHLIRCRQSYPDEKKVQCPYNATHLIGQCEYEYHVQHCSDMKKLVSHLVEYDNEQKYFEPVPIMNHKIECSENWDSLDLPTYDPTEHVEKNSILRLKQGVSQSQRRGFRESERRRISALTHQNKSSAGNRSDIDREDTLSSKVTALRRPNSVSVTKKATTAASEILDAKENRCSNNILNSVVPESQSYNHFSKSSDKLSKQLNDMSIGEKQDGFTVVARSKKSNLAARGRGKRNMTNFN